MYCMECGKELPEAARFCCFCGAPAAAVEREDAPDRPVGLGDSVQAFLDSRQARGSGIEVIESYRAALEGFDRYLREARLGIEDLDERVIGEYISQCRPETDREGLLYRLQMFAQYNGIKTSEDNIRAVVTERPRYPECETRMENGARDGRFPFRLTRYDAFTIHIRCGNCGNEFEEDGSAVKTDGDRVIFPKGMRCSRCGTATAPGSWYRDGQAAEARQGKHKNCPTCGRLNEAERDNCQYCGESFIRHASTQGTQDTRPVRRAEQRCPVCGGRMTAQVVSESREAGCFTVVLYILLALTIVGLLIVIPLALRKKTETVTYAVCQSCGHRIELNRA